MYKKPIRALLLAAGFGTRLRPLTLKTPKCLIEINNKPILQDWLEKLERINTQKVLINTHYLHNQVDAFLKTKLKIKIDLEQSFEETLLGTAGTLIANHKFFENSLGLLIHADNFSKFDLNNLITAHINRPSNCLMTMLIFKSQNPSSCGIVELDKNNIVKAFYEKESNPPGNLANGAIYVFDYELLVWIFKHYPNASDFSTEIIPNLLGKIYSYYTKDDWIDIGDINSLKKAREIASIQDN